MISRRSGTAWRDHQRMMRCQRLFAAYQRTGDRRKLKRANRLRRQVNASTVQRLNGSFQTFGDALRAAAVGIERSIEQMSRLMSAQRERNSA